MTQGIYKQVGTLTSVEAERHLVQVGLQVLSADFMPTSDYPALEERKCGFYRIRVNISSEPNVLFGAMVNGLMLEPANGLWICRPFVRHEHINVGADVLLNVPRQRAALGISGMEKAQITAALPNTDHNFLMALSPLPVAPLFLAADIGFVHLNSTVKQGLFNLFHGATYAMAEIPRGLVGTFVVAPQGALKLHGAHALLGFTYQHSSHEPLEQR